MRLGTSVVILPLHNPLEVAQQLAMVDLLSAGRLDFGIGRGFVAHDYKVLGVPYGEAQMRLLESLEVIRLQPWQSSRGSTATRSRRYAATGPARRSQRTFTR